jgi:hypothetical protein
LNQHRKKLKLADDLFSQFEDDSSCEVEENEGEEYPFNNKKSDELNKYLVVQIDK